MNDEKTAVRASSARYGPVWQPPLVALGTPVRIKKSVECPLYNSKFLCGELADGQEALVITRSDLIGDGPEVYPAVSDAHVYLIGFICDDEGRYQCGWFTSGEFELIEDPRLNGRAR